MAEDKISNLEHYFRSFRENVVGVDKKVDSPDEASLIYADWTASGRLYQPIENLLSNEIGPYVANTHTETSLMGSVMTNAYHQSKDIIKQHIGADDNDVLILCESGMTGAVNKLQRILGLKIHEKYQGRIELKEEEKPLIIISHMEHHSNQTSWIETIGDVVVVPPDEKGLFSLKNLREILLKYKSRKYKIAAITSCSNVTGILTPFYEIAEIMHENKGLCFVDFACSAPYVSINMHPENPKQKLDAIYFSPHKFLGGPGTPGVVAFCETLYHNQIPDHPGGGTVLWTNPWGEHRYINEIEAREDGGTPPFLQTIKTAKAILLKEEMGVRNMLEREEELSHIIWEGLENIPNLQILAPHIKDRLGIFSFYIDDAHYNLVVKILCDQFGIQSRGGCACAGTYGHLLLNIDRTISYSIVDKLDDNCQIDKPGWIRMSIHPIMSNEEVHFIVDSIQDVARNWQSYEKQYVYSPQNNTFYNRENNSYAMNIASEWFK